VARWESSDNPGFDFAEGEYHHHRRAGGLVHTRRVFFVKPDYWIVHDLVAGAGTHDLELWFHFPPCAATLDAAGRCVAQTPGGGLLIASFGASAQARIIEGAVNPIQGWVSASFESKTAAPALCYSLRASLPVGLVTLMAPCADGTPVVTALPNPEGFPAAAAVAVQWGDRCDQVLLAPADGRARDFGPFRSDARAACVSCDSSAEIIAISLCAATFLARRGISIVELPARTAHHRAVTGDQTRSGAIVQGGAR